ncbi:MAG: zinc carboxypeptidase [Actinomycetota bacterium]|nr:zinc carboxypeptidase [Actinomycetota bacterium]
MNRLAPALALVAGVLLPSMSAAQDGSAPVTPTATYQVSGVDSREERTAVAGTGAGIDEVQADAVVVRATPSERDAIAALGFAVTPLPAQARDFPAADASYHNHAETLADLDALAATHPGTVHRLSLGASYEGRDLAGVRISDDAQDTGQEPAVLFVGMHHAREHLTVEVALAVAHLFAESTDPGTQSLVASRQIYVVPMLNPDGGEYDVATGAYALWRKNRQPNAGTTAVGTDLNRNYGYRWGCCGGSSGNPASETYRGPSPFSTPEVDAVRRFVDSRPNLRAAISYHSYGDLILYPYGYTYTDVPDDMDPLDHRTLAAIAGQMASTTGYTAQQASDLYITDGDMLDWVYGVHGVHGFTFELHGGTYGFYPPDEAISAEVAKNRDAAIYLTQVADCPVVVAGGKCSEIANFDGDKDTDHSVFRPTTGTWFVRNERTVAFGTNGDIPVPADYDGKGTTDVAVFRPGIGVWFVEGGPAVPYGTNGDVPVPGDYDGDGDDDIAVFRPSTGVWFVDGGPVVQFGTNGDVPVHGDYNGDGTTDIAVFRPSTGVWFVDGGPVVQFGTNGDVPVPGDYGGDGITDVAVFRPAGGLWFVSNRPAVSFGTVGDRPLPLPASIYSALP